MARSLRRHCSQRTPGQRRRDDAIVLGSGLFAFVLSVLTMLFS